MVDLIEWGASRYLVDDEDMIAYLQAVAEENDPRLLQAALGDVAKARGMSALAREAGVGRESLYKSLSENGNPSFQTISKVVAALGARLTVVPA